MSFKEIATGAYWHDRHRAIFSSSCLSMVELPDESVQCVVTSPPYWGLRKYDGEQDLIWGDNHCEHEWGEKKVTRKGHPGTKSTLAGTQASELSKAVDTHGSSCSLCGAWRCAYGLEPTPELYVQHTVEILREIRRVLRKDGVVFWNIGDSSSGSWANYGGGARGAGKQRLIKTGSQIQNPVWEGLDGYRPAASFKHDILKPKDLCLIPQRVAIAAQEDGWWVRQEIIWGKENPMPESVTDRPTSSHEQIWMLTKSGTTQYWTHRDLPGTRERPKADYRWLNLLSQEEVAIEPLGWKQKIPCPHCLSKGEVREGYIGFGQYELMQCPDCKGKKEVRLWRRFNLWRGHDYYWDMEAVREISTERASGNKERKYRRDYGGPEGHRGHQGFSVPYRPDGTGRNLRSVWTFPTQPYPKAHFAVFPEALPERCIKAATPEMGCCAKCGAPWERVVERTGHINKREPAHAPYSNPTKNDSTGWATVTAATNTWRPTCKCNTIKPPVPSVVLDPFMGSGTTLKVAAELGRCAIGYDLSEQYRVLAAEKNKQGVLV